MNKIVKSICSPKYFFHGLLVKFGRFIPCKLYLSWMYYLRLGKRMNWKNPKTYNEICNWMKIF